MLINNMATRSILKKQSKDKPKSKRNIRFSESNQIQIIPTKEEIKQQESNGKKMEDLRALLNQKISDMQYELENNNIRQVKSLVKQVDHVLKRTKSGRWSGGKTRRKNNRFHRR